MSSDFFRILSRTIGVPGVRKKVVVIVFTGNCMEIDLVLITTDDKCEPLSKHNNQFTIWAFSGHSLKTVWSGVFLKCFYFHHTRSFPEEERELIFNCRLLNFSVKRGPPTPWLRLLLSFFNFVHTCQLAC